MSPQRYSEGSQSFCWELWVSLQNLRGMEDETDEAETVGTASLRL